MIAIDEAVRYELKFLISEERARLIQQKLKSLLPYDSHGHEGVYRVDSLYFDDIYGTYLKEKLDGAEKAAKFRIRAYDNDLSLLKLERKQKKGDLVSKKSLLLSREDYNDFIKNPQSFGRLFPELYSLLIRPKVIVSYERTAFVYEPGNVRITLDRNLRASLTHHPDLFSPCCSCSVFQDHETIFEVKYTGFLPSQLTGLTNEGLTKQSISKYALCRLSSLC